MRAVEKDRTRRYETAGGLARDVERFLSHEPVEAGPPSATYRLRKYARKHRGVLAMAGAFAALLMLAAAVSTRQAYLATKARNEAQKAYEQSRVNEAKANEQEVQARRSAAEAEGVLNFFENRVLAAARPEGRVGGLGRAVTLRQAIDAALPAVAQDFAAQPLVEARLRQTLGTSYYHLGDPAKAAEQYEASRALYARHRGPDDPDTLKSMDNLASSYDAVGRPAEALKLHEQALALMKAKLGPDHLHTLQTMNNLATSYYSMGRARPVVEAPRGDADAAEVEAGARSPRHAREHEQPRRQLLQPGPARRGAEALRGDAGAAEGQAGPRPPRHAREYEQPRRQLL